MGIEAVQDFRLGPLYTPMMIADENIRGLLFRPTGGGAASWTGAAHDPETGILYVPSINRSGVMSFYSPQDGTLRYTHGAPETQRLASGADQNTPRMPMGLPLLKPKQAQRKQFSLIACANCKRNSRPTLPPGAAHTGSGSEPRRSCYPSPKAVLIWKGPASRQTAPNCSTSSKRSRRWRSYKSRSLSVRRRQLKPLRPCD